MSIQMFSTFPQFVEDEMYRRRDVQRDGVPAGIQKPKSPWMRMMSNYRPRKIPDFESARPSNARPPKDAFLGSRRILMGGDLELGEEIKFGFDNLYERTSGTGERYRPKPSITSVSVDEKLQSFECTVEWKAYSIGQLNTLFPYFMNLGTSVIVDWGWNTVPPNGILDPNNKSQIRKQFSSVNENSSTDVKSANENIKPNGVSMFDHPKYGRLKKGQGRYSFVAGAIVDFSYSPDGNGSYSCTTEIMSLSKAMEKLRGEKQENRRKPEKQGQDVKPPIYEFIQKGYMDYLSKTAQRTDSIVSVGQGSGSNLNYLESGFSDAGYYISWGVIEQLVNNQSSLVKNEDSSEEEIRTFKLDSSDSIISSFSAGNSPEGKPLQLRSMDPLTCIVDVGGQSDKFRDFTAKPSQITKKLDDASIDPSKQGFLYNLYVEYQLVVVAFETNETIFDALKYILDKCSMACFDIWDFDLVIDSNVIRVVDRNMPQNSVTDVLDGQGDEFKFRPNTQVSILRDFSFDTNLDKRMKGQVVAQSNSDLSGEPSEDAARNAMNDSTTKIFAAEFEGTDEIIGGMQKPSDAETTSKPQSAQYDKIRSRALGNINIEGETDNIEVPMEDVEEARKGLESLNTTTGERFKYLIYSGENEGESLAAKFKQKLQASSGKFSPTNANNVINVNAEITLDGIGGFSAHQVLNIKQIPKIFENNGVFVIDSVTHDVSMDDWTTQLKTKFIVSNMQDKI